MTIITCCNISIWLRESPDHKQLRAGANSCANKMDSIVECVIGGENHSGKKILYPAMDVWVRVP